MKAIVGLGNPGPRFRASRHNAGWMVIDELVSRWRGDKPVRVREADVVRTVIAGEPVMLVKPLTFMNDSGRTVRALVMKDGLDPSDILVIYDDLDLDAGRVRIRGQGSAGGHRGILSIQQHLMASQRFLRRPVPAPVLPGGGAGRPGPGGLGGPSDPGGAGKPTPAAFPRLKVGIGRPPSGVDPIDFVLTGFTPEELSLIRPAIERAADAAECWVAEGTEVTANRFNGK